MTALAPATQHTKQLFIIDKNVDGWRDLVNNAGIGVSVLILDPLQDGLTQIANAITAYSNLDAIHILSHGSTASLQLGSATLNSENLNQYTQQLTTIGNALNENGDLLLYGCNVAQGETGQAFIQQLATATDADVAASDDLTGNSFAGADWILEVNIGNIEASPFIQADIDEFGINTLAEPLFGNLSVNPFGLIGSGIATSPAFGDIDNDGDLDAFIRDASGRTQFFRNNGTKQQPHFIPDSTDSFGLSFIISGTLVNSLQGWGAKLALVDIDADGDLDAFAANYMGGVRFVRNTGTASSPNFNGGFNSTGFGNGLINQAFADIDGDGDFDAFMGDSNGNTQFYRNIGTASSSSFSAEASNFGLTDVGSAASPSFADIDKDGDLDAFIGNYDGNTLFFRNIGTVNNPNFSAEGIRFGFANSGLLATPTFVDINNDGDLDAFVGNKYGYTVFQENTTPINHSPTGNVSINITTPQQGQTLTASNTLADVDGLGAITYTWKSGTTVLAAGNTYTVTQATVGNTITATASYIDLLGNAESAISQATAIVTNITANNPPTGNVFIDDITPKEGQVLTASNSISDADGLGTISYTWETVGGIFTTGNTYTVTAADVGKQIRLIADYFDQLGHYETVSSNLTAAVTGINTLPDLTVSAITPLTITVNKYTTLNFSYSVGDIGWSVLGDTPDFTSNFYLDGKTSADQIGTAQHRSFALTAQDFMGTVISQNLGLGEHTIWIETDVGNAIAETNEANNWASVTFTVVAPTEKPIADIFHEQGYYSAFADLAKAAYHLAPNELTGLGNNFVKPYANAAFVSVQQNWHVLTPTDLGGASSGDYRWVVISGQLAKTDASMADLGSAVLGNSIGYNYGNTDWTLEADGIYHGNNASAFAVRSGDALVLTFRGTNDNDSAVIPAIENTPDTHDWRNMTEHYGELLGFVHSIDAYVAANNIHKVYVTGHSLGGGMVLPYMLDHKVNAQTTADGGIINYEAVTFAAPAYSKFSTALDTRIVSIETDGDIVPDTGGYHEGRIVTINTPTTSGDYHSMDLYMAAAHALDAELPDTSINTASSVHGFDLNRFNNDGLIVTMATNEFTGGTNSENYSWKNEPAPQYVAMDGNNVINDLGVYQSYYEEAAYFLGGAGNDTIGHLATYQASGTLGKMDFPAGAIMRGGVDNDVYYVDHVNDKVIEKIDAGNDSVFSNIFYTLPENVENLTLTGTAINGTGNTLNNQLTGNSGNNILNGGAGADTVNFSGNFANYTRTITASGEIITDNIGSDGSDTLISIEYLNFADGRIWRVNLVLSTNSINENVAANMVIGILSCSDTINAVAYSLISGGDNDSFSVINGNQLIINNSPNFESKASYNITVRTTDQNGLFFDKALTISINNINDAPTNLAITASSINENVAAGSVICTLSSTDPDANNTFTYSLVAGGVDNSAFSIVGNQLKINASPDFETKASYSVLVRTTDQGGLFFDKAITISINNVNETPTNLALSATSINENVVAGSVVGTLSSTDPDAGNTFTYSLVTGTGSTDNSAFSIVGNQLKINSSPNFESKASYSVLVRTTDQGGLTFDKALTIGINNINETPTNLALSATSINENVAAGSVVGTLSSTDPDANNTFTYSLVTGTGSTDNSAFTVVGNQLKINNSPNFESKASYSVLVRTTDQGGLFFDKVLTIGINNVNETPTNLTLTTNSINENVATGSVIGTLSSIDPDASNTFTYNLAVGGVDNSAFSIVGNQLKINSSPDFETKVSYSVLVRTIDQGGLFFNKVLTINIINLSKINGTPNTDNLIGTSGNDIFDGLAGADKMTGGLGNDTYYVDNTGDVVTEFTGQGLDTVYSSISYTLTANIENLVLTGIATNSFGNNLNNQLTGNNANNIFGGGAGADTMTGMAGNDTYYVDNALDSIIENAGGGTDIVYSTAASYTLADNVESLIIWGAGINGVGNALSNYIISGTGNNIIDGGSGADIMYGGLGIDAYYVDDNGDVITEIGSDWDIAYSTAVSYALAHNVEALFLVEDGVNRNGTGNAQSNYLIGNEGNNSLDGQGGADVMAGHGGNDTYYIDNAGDLVIEYVNKGIDTVYSSISYTLAANTENLVLTGIATDAFGNNLNNQLTGNNANNIFGGGTGADTMIGLAGNDTYYVDDALDSIIENVGGGTDIVYSTAASYTLADNVESLIIWGAGVNGMGNAQSNYIISGTGNNTLDGMAGNDILYGGEGADTYIGGLGADSLNLTETTAATDTVRIATGDSLATLGGYDLVTRFKLGTGVFNTTGVDKLDLASTVIAANVTAADGIDSGDIHSHSINSGIISFDDINNYTSPLAISSSTNLASVFSYLQTNITDGNTVAFVAENNTFVFQDDGVTDTLVELLGVTATSVNNTGLTASSVWVI